MQIVTAAIIEKDGAVLIARRKKAGRFGGVWEFPGGKLEPGESPEECLTRELREELGIDVTVGPCLGSFVYHSSFLAIELVAYQVSILAGELILRDHDEVRWAQRNELEGLIFAEPDLPLLDLLLQKWPAPLGRHG